jgi:Protein of unknown function (DUF3306)
MSSEPFFSRWSKRKQAARAAEPPPEDAPPPQSDSVAPDGSPEAAAPLRANEGAALAETGITAEEIAALPSLEELTAETDMSGFLRKGVPEPLRNAALRRMWSLDPKIRDFVCEAREYAYDWNTPGGVPGTGELGAGIDVARMVSQIMGAGESAAESGSVADPEREPGTLPQSSEPEVAQEPAPDLPVQAVRLGEEGNSMAQNSGNEGDRVNENDAENAAPQQPVRRHGTAKPVV